MTNLTDIANALEGVSLTPVEAASLEALIKARTNATPATRAELDALTRAVKDDLRTFAHHLEKIEAMARHALEIAKAVEAQETRLPRTLAECEEYARLKALGER